jgi:peptidoglycan/xylan/chitin deacetylase (PgdA/CDA1 family)
MTTRNIEKPIIRQRTIATPRLTGGWMAHTITLMLTRCPSLRFFLTTLAFMVLSIQAGAVPESAPNDGTLRRIRVPILMYHYVSLPPANADDLRIELSLDPALFAEHITYLRDNNFQAISLYEISVALRFGHPLPPKPVVLTFDDGHLDHYTHVFPVLRANDFAGTFFVITAYADRRTPGHLTWEHINEMATAGMHIEPHTKNHFDLRNRDRDLLVYEILGSVESIAGHLGRQPVGFAYPAGQYDEAALAVMRQTPLKAAVTTRHGALLTSTEMLEMPRLRVTSGMSAVGLAHLLNARD